MLLGRSFRIGQVLGIEVRLDGSWFLVSVLIAWSLASLFGANPALHGFSQGPLLVMGAMAALLFFATLLAHELSHGLVARRKGIEVESITLFIFGGVASLKGDPQGPGDEFQIAIVGPATSLVCALVLFAVSRVAAASHVAPAAVIFSVIAASNVLLAAFNMLPGFPLDGGRVFRSAIWKATGDLVKATRVAALAGKVVAALIAMRGIYIVVFEHDLFGLVYVMMAMFLIQAGTATYRNVLVRRSVEGVSVADVMTPTPITVAGNVSVAEAVDSHFNHHRHSAFPVVGYGDHIEGIVTLSAIEAIPAQQREHLVVRQVMLARQPTMITDPTEKMTSLLDRVPANPAGRFMVMDAEKLVGILTPADISRYLQLHPAKERT
ncbi:MAG TPA: site-2 protease family protein [Actinomycetota bacterium]|nr:site-2 protease family protein [Actinomycetota bacterium]